MPESDPPLPAEPAPSGEEILLGLILEAAGRAETPASGLRAAAEVLCARPSSLSAGEDYDDEALAERIRTLLREGDAGRPEPSAPESSGPAEAWISLDRPVPNLEAPRETPLGPAKRGLARLLPRRRGLFLLVVISGIAAYIANTKGCSF